MYDNIKKPGVSINNFIMSFVDFCEKHESEIDYYSTLVSHTSVGLEIVNYKNDLHYAHTFEVYAIEHCLSEEEMLKIFPEMLRHLKLGEKEFGNL